MKSIWARIGIMTFWLTWPGIWLVVRWSRRTRVVIHADGQILLVKGWLSAGKWLLPGGGLHHSEDSKIGAARELSEETGINISSAKLRLFEEGRARETGLLFHVLAYHLELRSIELPRLQGLELTDAKWLPINEALVDPSVTSHTKHLLHSWQRTP